MLRNFLPDFISLLCFLKFTSDLWKEPISSTFSMNRNIFREFPFRTEREEKIEDKSSVATTRLSKTSFLAGGTLSASDAISASERDGRSAKKSHPRSSYQSPRLPPLQRQATLKSRENICSGCPPPCVFGSPPISTRIARLSCVPQPRVKNSINECCAGHRSTNAKTPVT